MNILFKDLALPQTIPFSRLRSIFSFRDGIFTPIERAKKLYGYDSTFYFTHPDTRYTELMAEVEGVLPYYEYDNETPFDVVITSDEVDTIKLLGRVKDRILGDFELVDKSNFLNGEELMEELPGIEIIGDVYNLYISKSVNIISRNIVIDTREGIVIIDDNTMIAPFTIISGTTYIGKCCEVINARISNNSIIGDNCRVSGEVTNSIFNDYAYKSHDGFLGMSILGTWVNLGALTSTSNLKNNYSNISIMLPKTMSMNSELVKVSTDTIKFGSFIGDIQKQLLGY